MYELSELCPVCGARSPDAFMPCNRCRSLMEYRGIGRCPRCGIDLAGSHGYCTSCRESAVERRILSVAVVGDWRGPLREWLSIYKYGGDARMSIYLSGLLLGILEEKWPGLPVVPVPPRRERMRKTGFDPVGVLADQLEKKGVCVARLLTRMGSLTQKGRSRDERLASGALDYRLTRDIGSVPGECVLLDDVSTTGATLDACASALWDAGAGCIHGLVVCRD